jgi:hypothetical protein
VLYYPVPSVLYYPVPSLHLPTPFWSTLTFPNPSCLVLLCFSLPCPARLRLARLRELCESRCQRARERERVWSCSIVFLFSVSLISCHISSWPVLSCSLLFCSVLLRSVLSSLLLSYPVFFTTISCPVLLSTFLSSPTFSCSLQYFPDLLLTDSVLCSSFPVSSSRTLYSILSTPHESTIILSCTATL